MSIKTAKEIADTAFSFAKAAREFPDKEMKSIHAQQSAVLAQYEIAIQLAQLNETLKRINRGD